MKPHERGIPNKVTCGPVVGPFNIYKIETICKTYKVCVTQIVSFFMLI